MNQIKAPAEARLDSRADALGLPIGLRVTQTATPFCCAACGAAQPAGRIAWAPVAVTPDLREEVVTELARRATFNGSWRGWCVPCAVRLRGTPAPIPPPRPRHIWRRALACLAFGIWFAVLTATLVNLFQNWG